MDASTPRFGFAQSAEINSTRLKWAMGATAILILSFWGWLNPGNVINTLLLIFVWWSFRNYFVQVGDASTAKWSTIIMTIFAVYGISKFLFEIIFDLEFLLQVRNGGLIISLFKGLFIILALSSLAIAVVCLKLLFTNRHHTFPLKRIALSSLFSLPLFLLVGSLGTLTFIGQVGDLMYEAIPEKTLYTDGVEVFHLWGDVGGGGDIMRSILGDVGGLFSFILSPFIFFYKVIIVLPYVFILHHFYWMDKWVG